MIKIFAVFDALQLCSRAYVARFVVCRLSVCPSVCHWCTVAKRWAIRPKLPPTFGFKPFHPFWTLFLLGM